MFVQCTFTNFFTLKTMYATKFWAVPNKNVQCALNLNLIYIKKC